MLKIDQTTLLPLANFTLVNVSAVFSDELFIDRIAQRLCTWSLHLSVCLPVGLPLSLEQGQTVQP